MCIGILCLGLYSPAWTQTLSGKITGEDNRPVELVNITVKQEPIIIKSGVTDSLGGFQFPVLRPGTYRISFSKIGFSTFDTSLVHGGSEQLTVKLKRNVSELREATVSTHKPIVERKIDRLIFNVENNINTSGLDALELLSKTPLLNVTDGEISIIGKESVNVMLDGRMLYLSKEALMALLRSIPSESIVSIEVITNPPARYDAAGLGGLVNIVTKKIRKPGYYGTVTSGLSYATDFVNRETLNFNYNTGKLQTFANVSFSKGANPMTSSNTIYYPGETWQQNTQNKEYYKVGMVLLGFEIPFTPKTTFGASYNRMMSYPNLWNSSTIRLYGVQNKLDSSSLNSAYDKKEYMDQSANFHFSHRFDSSGKKIEVDADYYANRFNTGTTINTVNYPGSQDTPTSIINQLSGNNLYASIYTLNAVATMPFRSITLSYGGKLSFITDKNGISLSTLTNGQYVNDSLLTNQFNVHEYIQAAFIDLDRQISKKIEIKAGLRGENTQIRIFEPDTVHLKKGNYFNLFPTLFLQYTFNDQDVLSVNYGRRIRRLAFSLLNPFIHYSNSYSYSSGNPDLIPYYSNNFELNYSHKEWYTYLSYAHTPNNVGFIKLLNASTHVQSSIPYNYMQMDEYTFTTGRPFNLFKRLQSTTEFSLFYRDEHNSSSLVQQHLSSWSEEFRSSNSITLDQSNTIFYGVDFTWVSSDVYGTSRSKGYYYLDLTYRQFFFKRRLQVTLAGRDIFKTKNIRWSETVNGIYSTYFSNNNSRRLGITLQYSFGNNKIKQGKSHTSGGDERGLVK